jgi:hypothetical protein
VLTAWRAAPTPTNPVPLEPAGNDGHPIDGADRRVHQRPERGDPADGRIAEPPEDAGLSCGSNTRATKG